MEEQPNIFALTKQDTAVLKGIAIIAMLMHHLWGCPPYWVEPYTGVLGFFGHVGKVCVALFLFCSGYGLSVGYSKVVDDLQCTMHDCKKGFAETLKFLAKRFVKFYAGYWPIFLMFVPLSVLYFGRELTDAYGADANICKCLMIDMFGMGGWSSYNITWWFNKLIILLYLLFPIWYIVAKRFPIVTLVVCVMMMRLSSHMTFDYLGNIFDYSFPFVLGIVGALHAEKMRNLSQWIDGHRWISILLSTALLITTLFLRVHDYIPHFSGGVRWDGVVTCAIVLFYICIRPCTPKVSNVISFAGKHSMNTYLIHTFFFGYWFPLLFYSRELGGGHEYSYPSHCLFVRKYAD